jgi:hypothetical protein
MRSNAKFSKWELLKVKSENHNCLQRQVLGRMYDVYIPSNFCLYGEASNNYEVIIMLLSEPFCIYFPPAHILNTLNLPDMTLKLCTITTVINCQQMCHITKFVGRQTCSTFVIIHRA